MIKFRNTNGKGVDHSDSRGLTAWRKYAMDMYDDKTLIGNVRIYWPYAETHSGDFRLYKDGVRITGGGLPKGIGKKDAKKLCKDTLTDWYERREDVV